MTLKIPTPLVSAIAASVVTAAVLGAFDAPAATSGPPSGAAPTLKNIYTRESLMDAQLDRIETKLKRLDSVSGWTHAVYDRLGKSTVKQRIPVQLMLETWCVVKEIPDDVCGSYGK